MTARVSPGLGYRARALVKRTRFTSCLAYLGRAAWCALRRRWGRIDSTSGTLHASLDVAGSLAYLQEVFDDYKALAGVTAFQGRVAELGPGDNAGVGLLFLQDGCSRVDLVDRFYARRDPVRQARIYEALARAQPGVARLLTGVEDGGEPVVAGLHRQYGESAAAERFFRDHGPYEVIVSRAVLEHVVDPRTALLAMAGALAPGGIMLHKVDLRDHGLFSERFHELAWLETPEVLHRWMTAPQGWPNRVLAHRYREILRESGVAFRILVTCLAGVGEVTPPLPWEELPLPLRARALAVVEAAASRLPRSLLGAAREDLAVTGIFLVGRKPS